MREAFFLALVELAEQDPRVNLISGDLGFGAADTFVKRFPRQFLNTGVAEQNMTGIAAGMALSGKVVFTYSIGNFPTIRCLEQIRNDICYHGANVKIVAVGGGYSYGPLGMSHHATEDLSIMRTLPGMVVVAPGDPIEALHATRAVAEYDGPCYLRLGRTGEAVIHDSSLTFELGRAVKVCDGPDVTIISIGGMLESAVRVAARLSRHGVHARVLSMHTLSPLDVGAVLAAASETGAVVTLEEHSLTGGLGSAVAEVLAEHAESRIPFKRLGLRPAFAREVGSQTYLRERAGISEEAILSSVMSVLPVTKES